MIIKWLVLTISGQASFFSLLSYQAIEIMVGYADFLTTNLLQLLKPNNLFTWLLCTVILDPVVTIIVVIIKILITMIQENHDDNEYSRLHTSSACKNFNRNSLQLLIASNGDGESSEAFVTRGVQVIVGHYNGNLPVERLSNLTDGAQKLFEIFLTF